MRLQELLEGLRLIKSKLDTLIEMETQHHKVVQDGRMKYIATWQESKMQVKIASEDRHKSPDENEKFLSLVQQSSAAVSAMGVEWISKGQGLAKKRRAVLQEVVKEVEQLADKLILEER